ncbi:MAG: twin-arginine translocase subunit TatC [Spirochaetes bacterium]|jgi:sec-independent protein translocase protein TatC|nr:twin-arginine translocase subunit TatC [Spirochaetota bacterium]
MKNKSKLDKKISDLETHYSDDNGASLRGDLPLDYSAHLGELRGRLLVTLSAIIIFFAIGLYFNSIIHDFLLLPIKNNLHVLQLKYDFMGESIVVQLKLALAAAITICLPLAVFQLWRFIRPAITPKNRMFIRIALFFALLLFYTGAIFCFHFIIPFTVRMIIQFAHAEVENIINMSNYFSFLLVLMTAIGVVFELPVIVALLTKLGVITPGLLIDKRKYAILAIWIFSAILTPPDILTQTIIAIPLMFLYELSLIISFLLYRKKNKK